MLHLAAELAEHVVGQIGRALRHEIDPDAFGADQTDDLFDLLQKRLGRVVEQQMRFVEEEDELRDVRIAHFRQLFEQLGQQPEQEGRVHSRRPDQLVGREDVDIAAPVARRPHQIVELEGGLAEKDLAAVALQTQKLALDRADALRGDAAVFACEFFAVLDQEIQRRTQIVEIEQRQPFVVGEREGGVDRAFLRVGQIKQIGQQQRPHLGDRRADGMALFAIHVPEHRRGLRGRVAVDPAGGRAFGELRVGIGFAAQTRQIAFDVGEEDRRAGVGEGFGEDLQRDGLARSGRAGDQPVPVGVSQRQPLQPFGRRADQKAVFAHAVPLPS